MMSFAFDPVAHEVEVRLDDGRPIATLETDEVQFKLYTEIGVLSAIVLADGSVELDLYNPEGRMVLEPAASSTRWAVRFVPAGE